MVSDLKEVLSTKNEELKTESQSTKYLSNLDIKQRVLVIGGNLVADEWVAWHCKAYKVLGENKYEALVSMAKDGSNPKTLFGWLIKQELKKSV